MKEWKNCKNILCIRPDNLGDLLMTYPAIKALKETFHCRITVLCSSMSAGLVPFLPAIDEHILFDVPWVRSKSVSETKALFDIVEVLKSKKFDAAVIFTVYSQNPLPSAMIAWLAGIPKRLAYCRENPYDLLTDWVPDQEPYTFIQHQVKRDLSLVASVGAEIEDERLVLKNENDQWPALQKKIMDAGIDLNKPWLIMHAGVSEPKRQYPNDLWIKAGKQIVEDLDHQIILTGTASEKNLVSCLQQGIGHGSFSLAGELALDEFITLISHTALVISVNTATVHIAAAVGTPVVVLYAITNPQHTPWMAKGKLLLYDIPQEMRSRNEVIRYVSDQLHLQDLPMLMPEEISDAVRAVLQGDSDTFPDLIPLRSACDQIF